MANEAEQLLAEIMGTAPRALDGDTIRQEDGDLRVTGVDTPETGKSWKGTQDQPNAALATQLLREVMRTGTVTPTGEPDVHGRGLADVTRADGEDYATFAIRNKMGTATGWSNQEQIDAETAGFVARRGILPELMTDEERAIAAQRDDRPWDFKLGDMGGEGRSSRGTFGRAMARGADNLQATGYAAANAGASFLGIEGVGEEGLRNNLMEAAANPAEIGSFDNVKDLGDFGTYVAEALGEQMPNLLAMATGAGVTATTAKAMFGKALLEKMTAKYGAKRAAALFAKRSALGGVAATSYPMGVGEIQQELKGAGIDAPGTALLGGIPFAALDAAGVDAAIGRFFGKEVKRDVARAAVESIWPEVVKKAGAGLAIGTAGEGVTEAMQEVVSLAAHAMHDPEFDVFSDENIARIREAGIKGGLVGGILGGAGGAASGYNSATRKPEEGTPDEGANPGSVADRPAASAEPTAAPATDPAAERAPPLGDVAPGTHPTHRPGLAADLSTASAHLEKRKSHLKTAAKQLRYNQSPRNRMAFEDARRDVKFYTARVAELEAMIAAQPREQQPATAAAGHQMEARVAEEMQAAHEREQAVEAQQRAGAEADTAELTRAYHSGEEPFAAQPQEQQPAPPVAPGQAEQETEQPGATSVDQELRDLLRQTLGEQTPTDLDGNTTPEPTETIAAGLEAVARGGKPAVYSKDRATAQRALSEVPGPWTIIDTTDGGVLVTRPESADRIRQLEAEGKRHAAIGYAQSKGTLSIDQEPRAVRAIDRNGREASAQLADAGHLDEAQRLAREHAGPGGTVDVTTAAHVLSQRDQKVADEEAQAAEVARPQFAEDLEESAPRRIELKNVHPTARRHVLQLLPQGALVSRGAKVPKLNAKGKPVLNKETGKPEHVQMVDMQAELAPRGVSDSSTQRTQRNDAPGARIAEVNLGVDGLGSDPSAILEAFAQVFIEGKHAQRGMITMRNADMGLKDVRVNLGAVAKLGARVGEREYDGNESGPFRTRTNLLNGMSFLAERGYVPNGKIDPETPVADGGTYADVMAASSVSKVPARASLPTPAEGQKPPSSRVMMHAYTAARRAERKADRRFSAAEFGRALPAVTIDNLENTYPEMTTAEMGDLVRSFGEAKGPFNKSGGRRAQRRTSLTALAEDNPVEEGEASRGNAAPFAEGDSRRETAANEARTTGLGEDTDAETVSDTTEMSEQAEAADLRKKRFESADERKSGAPSIRPRELGAPSTLYREPDDEHSADQVTHTKAIPKREAAFAAAMLKHLGIPTRLHIVERKDARDGRIEYHGDRVTIVLDPSTRGRPGHRIKVLIHELGHLVQRATLDQASPETRKAMVHAFRKSQRDRPGKKAYPNDEHGFSEWFANELKRWVAHRSAPRDLVGKFFKKLGAVLRKLFLKGKLDGYYKPDATFAAWLDSLAGVAANTRAGRLTRFAAEVAELQMPVNFPANMAPETQGYWGKESVEKAMGTRAGGVLTHHTKNVGAILTKIHGVVTQSAGAYLRGTGQGWLADKFHVSPDASGKVRKADFDTQARLITGKFHEQLHEALEPFTKGGVKNRIFGYREGKLDHKDPDYKAAEAALIEAQATGKPPQGLSPRAQKLYDDVRKIYDDLHDTLTGPLKLLIEKRAQFFPVIIDNAAWMNDHDAIMDILTGPLGMSAKQARWFYERTAQTTGAQLPFAVDVKEAEAGPGFSSARERAWKPKEVAALKQYLIADIPTATHAYIETGVRRGVINRSEGKVVKIKDERGNETEFNDPMFKIRARLQAEVDNSRLSVADHDRITKTVLPALLGQLGAGMDPRLKRISQAAVAFENIRLLGLVVLSSLVDPAGLVARGGFKATWNGARDVLRSSDRKSLTQQVRLMGAIKSDLTEHIVNDAFATDLVKKGPQVWSEHFFRLVRAQAWTNFTRVLGISAGRHFLRETASEASRGDKRALRHLKELNVTHEQVAAWVADQQPLGADAGHTAVQHALLQFLDEAILRPNPSHRPAWASHPGMAIFWHLKSFMWSYYEVILKHVWSEGKARWEEGKGVDKLQAAFPAAALVAVALPLGLLGYEARQQLGWLGGDRPTWSDKEGMDLAWEIVQRSGLLGPSQLFVDAGEAGARKRFAAVALAGPTVGHLEEFLTKPLGTTFLRSIPGLAQMPAAREWAKENLLD